MALSDVQAGRIGEYLLAVYAMLTSDGALVPFQVDADDDHRDLVVAVKGKSTFASLQAKACFALGESGFVQSNATYFADTIPREPSWIYVIVLVRDLVPAVWWVIPAPDFNSRVTQSPARAGREVELHFRAYPDRDDAFAPFRCQTKDLGPRLLAVIDALPPATEPQPGARLLLTKR
ncbi:MAG TPA: hypothetical protein VJS19_10025 [Candidatus Dormibacteraeota bacterium]|nr:hypothetical protein [Candidatus Dormibacteraeota bacterium]